eukprot:g9296.t1
MIIIPLIDLSITTSVPEELYAISGRYNSQSVLLFNGMVSLSVKRTHALFKLLAVLGWFHSRILATWCKFPSANFTNQYAGPVSLVLRCVHEHVYPHSAVSLSSWCENGTTDPKGKNWRLLGKRNNRSQEKSLAA